MATKDPFSTPLSDLNLRDWAKELPKPVLPTVATGRGSSGTGALNSAANMIRLERQRQQLEKQRSLGQLQQDKANPPQLPTFDQASRQVAPNYDQLPFSEQQRMYTEYVKNSVAALKDWSERTRGKDKPLDEFELEEAIRSRNPAPVAPDRSWGEVATDVGRGLAAGAVSIPATAIAAFNPASETAKGLTDYAEEIRGNMSAVEQDRQRQIAFDTQQLDNDPELTAVGRFLSEAGIQISNMSLAGMAELIGNIGPTLLASGGVGLMARVGASAAGATAATAANVGGRAAMVAGVGSAPVLAGGDAAQGAYQTVMELPDATLENDPDFSKALANNNGDRQAARREVAMGAARIAQAVGSASGLVFSALPGSLERSVGRAVGGRAAAGGVGRAAAGRVGESTLEGAEEAFTQVGQNIGVATVDPTQSLAEGAGGAAALGAMGGGAGGVAVSLAGRRGRNQQAPSESETTPNLAAEMLGQETQAAEAPVGVSAAERLRTVLPTLTGEDARSANAALSVLERGETVSPEALANAEAIANQYAPPSAPAQEAPTQEAPTQADPTVAGLIERMPNYEGDDRLRAIELITTLRNPNTPESVRELARQEANQFIENMTVDQTDQLTPEQAREMAAAYRAPVDRPLEELQQAVRESTDFTTQERVEQVVEATENAYIEALIANTDPVAAVEAAAVEQIAATEPSNYAQAVAEADNRVRQSRINAAVQNLIDNNEGFTSSNIISVNRSLSRIGEPPLSAEERARVQAMTEAYQAFTNYLNPEGQPEPVIVPRGVDNSSMEARIRERGRETNTGPRPVQRTNAEQGRSEPVATGEAGRPVDGRATQTEPVVTEAARRFNEAAEANFRRVGFNPEVLESIETTFAPAVQSLAQRGLGLSGERISAVRQMREAIEQAQNVNPKIANAIRNTMRQTEPGLIGPGDGSALGYVSRQLGLGQTIRGAMDPWAKAARAGGDGRAVLEALANDPTAGELNQSTARSLIDAYDKGGIAFPRSTYRGVSPGLKRGVYYPSEHVVQFFPNTQARSVSHEFMHGLTARGLEEVNRMAKAGNVEARNLISLTEELYAKLKKAAGQDNYRGNADLYEMLAELVTPEYIELAAQTPVGALSEGAQAALTELGVTPRDSILDAIQGMIKRIVDLIAPGHTLTEGNIADTLAQVAAEYTRWSRTQGLAARPQVKAAGPAQQAMFDTPVAPGVSPAEQARHNATEAGAENIEGTDADVRLQSPRDTYTELTRSIESGEAAPPATEMRAFSQAMRRGDTKGMREAVVQFGEFLNVKLHDHLANVKRWAQNLPEGEGGVSPVLKEKLIGDLYRAPAVRDATLRRGMEENGGREIQAELAKLSSKYKVSAETATQLAGYWITAKRAEAANKRLIDRDATALKKAQDLHSQDPSPENAMLVSNLAEQLNLRVQAVTNPDVTVKTHVKGVGGFSNAQAQNLMAKIEARMSRADLDRVAQKVYDFNAWRLATDVETGKADPAVVAGFLNMPELEPVLASLRVLSEQSDANNAASVQALEAKRKEVIEKVRSDYVPLTGDPDTALMSEVFSTGSRAPNISPDYAMEGRTTSIPDDGITASFAGALKTASYSGWSAFQDSIAQVYNSLSPENREVVGIERQPLDGSGVMIGQNAIIRRRGNTAYAYRFRDSSFIEAIRGANVDDTNHTLAFIGKPTKWFAYAVTQLNPFFAPRNYIRDAWERSELSRTREYLNEDGQPIDSKRLGRDMLAYTFNPSRAAPLVTATGRMAFNRPRSNTREALMLQEMLAAGGGSVWGDRFTGDRKKFVDGIMRERKLRKSLRPVAQLIDAYNRSMDMAPALASYMALRDQGVPPDRAAAGALDLMNFRKRGASMPIANALYAFAQPAVTGGANALASIYNPKTRRFSRVGLTRLMGYTLTLAAIQAFARSLSDDDEGGNKLDQLGNFVHDNNLVIPFGDGVVRIPLAFGTTRLANGMARAMLGMGTNEQTPGEAFGNYFSGSVIPVFSPIDDTDIDWKERPIQAFMMTFAPTWMKPVVSVGVNRTAFDSPVVFDNYEKTDQFRSEQFGKTIPPIYQDVARFLRANTGIDMAPEEVRTLIRGFPLGPGTMLLDHAVENPYRESRGLKTENPFLRQIYSGYSQQAIKGQFYDAIEDTTTLLRRRTAQETLDEDDRRKVAWRLRWDDIDKELRKERAAVTKSGLSEQAKEQRYLRIQRKRDEAQTVALYQYRQLSGKQSKRVNVPAQWVQ